MKIKDVLQRDPLEQLVNQGQARIWNSENALEMQELRGELSTFVCEGQYAEGIQKIVRSYLDNLGKTSQRGAWVSGFFGSGKSHLLKMLCHLWQDTGFPDGSTARSLVPSIPEDLRALFRELDTAGKRAGGVLAAAGPLLGGTMDHVRLDILGILLRVVGLPPQYPQARFCFWLRANGYYDRVKAGVEKAGRNFERELNDLYVSGPIARAVIECDANFATSEAAAKQHIKDNFPPQTSDIRTEDFLTIVKDALKAAGRGGRMPCMLLVLDEVQQYIGDSLERSSLVTEVAEAVCKQLDSHVMIVGAGQNALTDMLLLQKLMDRFTIRVPLSDAEVESVTRKVLLQKKPTAVADVRKVLDAHAGEISRQLQGTSIGERTEDRALIVDDYPLLPVRRRFWEHCFRQIDLEGTHSQLRSQLRIIHDAIELLADKRLGAVVPADYLFEAIAPEMVITGVLLREINERIIHVGKNEGPLAQRICGLVFLIGKLKHEGVADIGVRATKEHLADLLVDDLSADNGKLRSEVEAMLKKLSENGVVMVVGDEYRLQTREGTDWDREFRNRQTKLSADEKAIQFRRDQLLYAEADRIVRSLRLTQGAAKEARQFSVHRDQTPPAPDGATIPVWVRDQWSCAQKEVEDAARSAGIDSPIIYVFISRQSADDLRHRIVEAEAAEQTLNTKGNPASDEGREARASMDGRRAKAAAERDRLAGEIVANAKVFQGGGGEVMLATLEERVRAAAEASLVRLFPRFKDADASAWDVVIKRARDGADHPFQPVGHTDATEKHAVCQQVIATIGSGKTGTDIRKALRASPYGWPQDAIDAALIALHRSQHLTATLNGVAVPLGQLDQNKIAKAEFRVEQATLTVQDRLALRKLYSAAGISCKSGEEAVKASEFLAKLIALGGAAGGPAPLPTPPSMTDIEDIQRLVGNAQLVAIKDKAPELEAKIKAWQAAGELAAKRKPVWDTVERLARHAAGLDGAKPILDQVEAVREGRLLLEATDHVAPLRLALAKLLRESVYTAHASHMQSYGEAMATLTGNETWRKLAATDQNAILTAVGLVSPKKPEISTDETLIESLDRQPPSTLRAEIDAISGRVARAIERAAKLLEPKVRAITIERSTLRSPQDVEKWLERQKALLLAALAEGPVLIQ